MCIRKLTLYMVRVDFYEILKLVVRTAIFHPWRNKSFSPSSFQVCIFKNFLFLDSRYLILDSRILKLKRLKFQDARIKFRGSSRDCQLTFDWYCSRQYCWIPITHPQWLKAHTNSNQQSKWKHTKYVRGWPSRLLSTCMANSRSYLAQTLHVCNHQLWLSITFKANLKCMYMCKTLT